MISSFKRTLLRSSSSRKENQNDSENMRKESAGQYMDMETDFFGSGIDNEIDEEIYYVQQNETSNDKADSFRTLRNDAAHFFKENTTSFVESAREWGRTASFEINRNARKLSFDLSLSRTTSSDSSPQDSAMPFGFNQSQMLESTTERSSRTPSNATSESNIRSRTPSFDFTRSILNATPPNIFTRKRSSATSGEVASVPFSPWKRRGTSINSKRSSKDLSPGIKKSRLSDDFNIIDVIGKGNFGSVYRVKGKLDNATYAVKQSCQQANTDAKRLDLLREVQILAILDAECSMESLSSIVRYYSSWFEDDYLYIQLEVCEASVDILYFDIPKVSTLLRDILKALKVIHCVGVVHLDVKPGNILLKNDHYKLCDFGMAVRTQNGEYHGDIDEGDTHYMARELLEWTNPQDLRKCDVFSLGITGIAVMVSCHIRHLNFVFMKDMKSFLQSLYPQKVWAGNLFEITMLLFRKKHLLKLSIY